MNWSNEERELLGGVSLEQREIYILTREGAFFQSVFPCWALHHCFHDEKTPLFAYFAFAWRCGSSAWHLFIVKRIEQLSLYFESTYMCMQHNIILLSKGGLTI